jgi:hypothetical protein
MAQENDSSGEPISKWEKFYDNIFLLFILGMGIPFTLYTIWGVYELLSSPASPLVK